MQKNSHLPAMIAIDGPAGSGKSTVAEKLAEKIGYLFFDTGVMYRAVTLAAQKKGVDLLNEQAVTHVAQTVQIDVRPSSVNDGRKSDILLDGEDVTWEVRLPEVEKQVSIAAAYAGVRSAMTLQQRRIGERGQVVMVGRDIATVVLPDAELKIYLDASVEERARRRFVELQRRGTPCQYDEVLASMKNRDHLDTTRDVAPLRVAEGAVVIDSDKMSESEVLDVIVKLVDG